MALATFSGNIETCEYLLALSSYDAFNKTSICTPMSVAVLTNNISMIHFYLKFENDLIKMRKECMSKTIHGVCPLKLAQLQNNQQIYNILYPLHKDHILGKPNK